MSPEAPGPSVFCKDGTGDIFHTYFCYVRGGDMLIGAYPYLDLAPLGRQEEKGRGMEWVRHHDRYGDDVRRRQAVREDASEEVNIRERCCTAPALSRPGNRLGSVAWRERPARRNSHPPRAGRARLDRARARLPEGQFRAVPAKTPGKVGWNPSRCPQGIKVVDPLTLWATGDSQRGYSTERTACLRPTIASHHRTTGSTSPTRHLAVQGCRREGLQWSLCNMVVDGALVVPNVASVMGAAGGRSAADL